MGKYFGLVLPKFFVLAHIFQFDPKSIERHPPDNFRVCGVVYGNTRYNFSACQTLINLKEYVCEELLYFRVLLCFDQPQLMLKSFVHIAWLLGSATK